MKVSRLVLARCVFGACSVRALPSRLLAFPCAWSRTVHHHSRAGLDVPHRHPDSEEAPLTVGRQAMFHTDRPRRLSNVLLGIGAAATFVGIAAAMSWVGLLILVLVPLPFTGGAVIVRSRWREGAALFV